MTCARQLYIVRLSKTPKLTSMWSNNTLDLSVLPIVWLACYGLQLCSELLQHGRIVACIITGDMTNLYSIIAMRYWKCKDWKWQCTYLMLNSQSLDYLEQSLAKPFTIVCIVESGEANESTLELPFSKHWFLDLVCCDHKIAVSIAHLPCITCQANFTLNHTTLQKWRMLDN